MIVIFLNQTSLRMAFKLLLMKNLVTERVNTEFNQCAYVPIIIDVQLHALATIIKYLHYRAL